MKKIILGALLTAGVVLGAADVVIKNGVPAWSDRKYTISNLPENIKLEKSVPLQQCSGNIIKFPAGTSKAMVALCEGPGLAGMLKDKSLKLTDTGWKFNIVMGKGKSLYYRILLIEEPGASLNCRPTNAGGVLLAVNENIPALEKKAEVKLKSTLMPEAKKLIQIPGQEYRFRPGQREFTVYVRYPDKGVNDNTGLMLLSHNWGGTWKYTAPWCDLLSNRFNLICLSVDYLQSGEVKHDQVPYDHGLLQAVDCLRALYVVQQELDSKKIKFNRRRIYAAGASGGGNVSLMVNKLAPASFACIIDLCGMPGLTDQIAYGIGKLNAGYSKDPASPKYLSPAMQEIRDPGNPVHLAIQKKLNPGNKVVIVHGLDDQSCNPADKMLIASVMVRANFRPDTHFLTGNDVDGVIVRNTAHSLGNRPEIISKFGGNYIAEDGKFAALIQGKSDFDAQNEIVYPVTGGKYIISFKGMPTVRFEK